MSEHIDNIVTYLQNAVSLYEKIQTEGKGPQLIALRNWQCKRLLDSHAAMYKDRKYRPAIQFFVDELYGPKDFTQRDRDIEKVVPKMKKWLPEEALESLAVAIHLNALSQELDVAMLEQLQGAEITAEGYASAYYACNNQSLRKLQIDYIEQLGMDLAKVVDIPGIGFILKMARAPARMAGLDTLQQFLEDGFSAFKQLGNVEDFILPVVNTERELMNALFNGENPLSEIAFA